MDRSKLAMTGMGPAKEAVPSSGSSVLIHSINSSIAKLLYSPLKMERIFQAFYLDGFEYHACEKRSVIGC